MGKTFSGATSLPFSILKSILDDEPAQSGTAHQCVKDALTSPNSTERHLYDISNHDQHLHCYSTCLDKKHAMWVYPIRKRRQNTQAMHVPKKTPHHDIHPKLPLVQKHVFKMLSCDTSLRLTRPAPIPPTDLRSSPRSETSLPTLQSWGSARRCERAWIRHRPCPQRVGWRFARCARWP